jgi:hypothetical protein
MSKDKEDQPIKLPPGRVNPLEGLEMVEIYRDDTTVITANRPLNKKDGEAIQLLVARLGNKIPPSFDVGDGDGDVKTGTI